MVQLINIETDAKGNVLKIDMPRPSNFHVHLRSDALMRAIAHGIMRWVKYLLVMPNTGPIDTIGKLLEYHTILKELSDLYGFKVEFIMTLYLTDKVTPVIIEQLSDLPFKTAIKYYPPHRGATTGSGLGIPLYLAGETLKKMSECGIRLLGHFESVHDRNGRELPWELREGYFMEHEWLPLRESYPDLFINIEHATTALAIQRVKADISGRTACGITPQGMYFIDQDLKRLSYANHLRCMPIAKTRYDCDVVADFATSGDYRCHLGDDNAAHLSKKKLGRLEDAACGCYLPHSLALYAFIFKMMNRLDERFIKFACFNGPDWWGLLRPANEDRVMLVRDTIHDIPEPTPVPEEDDVVIPLGWTNESDRLKIELALRA